MDVVKLCGDSLVWYGGGIVARTSNGAHGNYVLQTIGNLCITVYLVKCCLLVWCMLQMVCDGTNVWCAPQALQCITLLWNTHTVCAGQRSARQLCGILWFQCGEIVVWCTTSTVCAGQRSAGNATGSFLDRCRVPPPGCCPPPPPPPTPPPPACPLARQASNRAVFYKITGFKVSR